MKKKSLFILPLIGLSLTLSLGACSGGSGGGESATTLKVVCLNSGYGDEWIKEAVRIWESQNEGYKVDLDATTDAKSVIASNIAKKVKDDVYISVGSEWKTYAGQGKLLELDDFLDEKVDGMTVKDKVADEYKDSIYFKDKNGDTHSYRLPSISGTGGIMYNAKMFADHGWEVPTTVDKLLTLCEKIVNDKVQVDPTDPTAGNVLPFAYTGANTDYFDYTVYSWWSQLAGIDAIKTFKNYTKDSKTNFDVKTNATYAKLKQATDAWWSIFQPKTRINEKGKEVTYYYYDPEDISRDNHTPQKNFMNGKAAMMFNGDWVYNELLGYTSAHKLNEDKFQLAIMDTPKISADAINNGYVIGEDQYIAIPKYTSKPELAKSFVKTLISDEVLKIFFNKAHGMMAFKLSEGQYDTSDNFMSSLMDYRSHLSGTFTNFSLSPLFLNGYVDFWGASSGRPFLSLLQGTTKTVDDAFNNIYDNVKRQWDTWVKNSRM